MAQGKAFTKEEKDEIVLSLKTYFQLGYSIKRACQNAGFNFQRVYEWVKDDEVLRTKIEAWQNEISAKARENWREQIRGGDYQASKDWLERREKREFSTRVDVGLDEGITDGFETLKGILEKLSETERNINKSPE